MIINEKIDTFNLNKEQKNKLTPKNIIIFYDEYKKNHTYFSLTKIISDFLFYSLNINPNTNKEGVESLKKGLKQQFISILRKDEYITKYSKKTYKICNKIVRKINDIPTITKKNLILLIKNSSWDFNEEYEKKFKINNKKFILNNNRIKILLALLKKELSIEELSIIINDKTTSYYYINYLNRFGFLEKYRLSNGYRNGCITYYKIKDKLMT